VTTLPLHAAFPQIVSAPGNEHCVALWPAQLAAQGPAPAQAGRPPCGNPLGTVVQRPSEPGTSQASH
jgi:hypothetical protein